MVEDLGPGLHVPRGRPVDPIAYERWTGRWSRMFVPTVIAAAGVAPGDTVLDVCTGTGEAARLLTHAVGPTGRVVGVDIAPAMVRAAQTRLADPGFYPVTADGQALPFRGASFDAVVCQLGLQFFPQPARGLVEFRRVLRPNGSVGVCVISTPERAPMWGVVAEELLRLVPDQQAVLELSFSLSDATRLRSLFVGAALKHVSVRRAERHDTMTSFAEYWDALEHGAGSMPQIYRTLPAADRHSLRDRVETRLSRFVADGQLVMGVEMLIASGQA